MLRTASRACSSLRYIGLSAFANVFEDGEIDKCYPLFKINEHLNNKLEMLVH